MISRIPRMKGQAVYLESKAYFSPDRRYRYELIRVWDKERPRINFVCLNPSKADHEIDDPTVWRAVTFAERWGYGEFRMYNLFALVSTDPRALCNTGADIVGPENNRFLADIEGVIVIAWGSWGKLHVNAIEARAETVRRHLQERGHALYCLGKNQDGEPKHPLYLPAETPLIDFYPRERQPGFEGPCPGVGPGLGCYRPCSVKQITGHGCPLGKDPDKGLVFPRK
jgi:hypothetical protein